MNKQIVHVEPVYKERIWGGTLIKTRFHAQSDVDHIGEMWCVCAMKDNGDNVITELGLCLSEVYKTIPEWFGCRSDKFPIRCTFIDPIEDVSIQVHPNDIYAKTYSNSQGKNEAWYILETETNHSTQLGHKANSKDEFRKLAQSHKWDELLTYIQLNPGDFVDVPYGTVHAIGQNTVVFEIASNADITYRIYDYDRIDIKTGTQRDLHLEKALDVISFPHSERSIIHPESVCINNCLVSNFIDEAGKYTLKRVEVKSVGEFVYSHFYFITIIAGGGSVNGISVTEGNTLLVPQEFGPVTFTGPFIALISSYHD